MYTCTHIHIPKIAQILPRESTIPASVKVSLKRFLVGPGGEGVVVEV
jgi:hypothetical protein